MRTRRSHQGKTVVTVLAALAAVAATAWYASAGGESRRSMQPLVTQPQPESFVVPASYLAAADVANELEKSGNLTLSVKDGNTWRPITGDGLLKLNGSDFDAGFRVQSDDFRSDAEGGEVSIRSGNITLVRDKTVPKNTKVRGFPIELSLDELIGMGERSLVLEWTSPKGAAVETNSLTVKLDTVGPTLRYVELRGDLDKGPELLLEFDSGDFLEEAAGNAANYSVERIRSDGRFEAPVNISAASIDKVKKNVVRVEFAKLDPGVYRVTVIGVKPTDDGVENTPLKDISGNYAGGSGSKGTNQERIVGANPPPKPGKFVEFPEFQPTLPQPQTKRRINPGDKVVTEVVRLYYYRDAHRVAQLINRTAESLNRAAVDLARRRAEDARSKADEATDERRRLEREAVRAAEELRRAENEVARARQDLTAAEQNRSRLEERKVEVQKQIDALNPNGQLESDYTTATGDLRQTEESLRTAESSLNNKRAEVGRKEREIRDLEDELQRRRRLVADSDPQIVNIIRNINEAQTDLAELRTEERQAQDDFARKRRARDFAKRWVLDLEPSIKQLRALENELASLDTAITQHREFEGERRATVTEKQAGLATIREKAVDSNENAIQAQAKEDRAREGQFRLEVAAAHEDPDTYAPAKLDSVDPVAQVSVQVIGEGLIQLRGPQKGISRIKTAINQIDSPVGQVKVEVVTVQINGERGERMEAPLGRIEAHLGLGRFLTSQSLMLLRQAIQEEATRIAQENDQGGHYQVDRDRKYLYHFFGRDFIDELYEMDSEFLNTENKLLSLHSMDTVSLHQALFVMALARNEVRRQILANFMGKIHNELVQAEFDYRSSAELCPFKTHKWKYSQDPRCRQTAEWYQAVASNNELRYHFRNLLTFFNSLDAAPGDTMNPMQREFIRLAQIFKARLIAELELKQRVIERAMIEDDRLDNLAEEEQARNALRPQVLRLSQDLQRARLVASEKLAVAIAEGRTSLVALVVHCERIAAAATMLGRKADDLHQIARTQRANDPTAIKLSPSTVARDMAGRLAEFDALVEQLAEIAPPATAARILARIKARKDVIQRRNDELPDRIEDLVDREDPAATKKNLERFGDQASLLYDELSAACYDLAQLAPEVAAFWRDFVAGFDTLADAAELPGIDYNQILASHARLGNLAGAAPQTEYLKAFWEREQALFQAAKDLHLVNVRYNNARGFLTQTRQSLERRKLLDFLIEEYEYKHIDLLEGTRAHIATMDNYLKRLAIALEDDFKLQFYDPAFVRIRSAMREWDVTLGQVERTSILTNNRAFAKVTPQATMEFDLPKRKMAVVEALDGAKALVEDYGALLNDPTFLAAYKLMGGDVHNGKVQNVVPGLPSQTDEQQMGFSGAFKGPTGSSLESLVPDPSVYKFETGTGFEIRPVIQPDGNSIVYDFTYMYTTNVREPVRADEKHLGRIKRHFINTQVQTTSFELREVSRYQVALKAARTTRGVPLLQDIPLAGVLFRPLPSAESSVQQNVILASSVVYPTLFDLMGLRWAPSVVDLDHISVRDEEHVVRGRYRNVKDSVFDTSSRVVDEVLGIPYEHPKHYRPDLYHRQRLSSPYHPGGYTCHDVRPDDDPTGQGFETPDRRPVELREPPYDRRFRRPLRYETIPSFEGERSAPIQPSGETAPLEEIPPDPAVPQSPDDANQEDGSSPNVPDELPPLTRAATPLELGAQSLRFPSQPQQNDDTRRHGSVAPASWSTCVPRRLPRVE